MNKKALLLLLLVVALVACLVACSNNGSPVATGTAGSSTDPATDPTTTEPTTTEPEATEPGTTEPGTTEPETTEPPVEIVKPALPAYTPPSDASVYDAVAGPDTSWYDAANPQKEYTLTTANQLVGFHALRSETFTYDGITIKLACDVILNAGTVDEILARADKDLASVISWKQLNSAYQFKGTFDGQGHTISGVYLQTAGAVVRGMFGGVGGNAVIKNFTLTNSYFGGPTTGVGKNSLAAIAPKIHANSNVTISDVTVSAYMLETDQKFDRMAGFVGSIDGENTKLTMQNCTFNGIVQISGSYAGGMIALVQKPTATITLINCTNNANIYAANYTGGMIGSLITLESTPTLTNCTNNGVVYASSKYVGGIVGNVNAYAINETGCTNKGTVAGPYAKGDLYGFKSVYDNGARPETPAGKTALRVMSFNVQGTLAKESDKVTYKDITKNRMTALLTEVQTYAPDLLGLQEDSPEWITYFDGKLTGYNRVSDQSLGGGEQCAIYYKKGMNLVASGSKWLTQDGTNQTVGLSVKELTTDGSKYRVSDEDLAEFNITKDSPDSDLKKNRPYTTSEGKNSTFSILGPRRMTWAIFEINGQYVIYINTHLQHRSQTAEYSTDAYQRIRSMERVKTFDMIQDQLKELKKTYADAINFLTGDFNDLVGTAIYNSATIDYGYKSSHLIANERYGIDGTWNNAMDMSKQGSTYPATREGTNGSYLDYCFVSDGIDVLKFRVGAGKATITGVDGKETTVYTSDHLPIITDLCFGG